jgi:beta-lactamase superfamily II metal-dependent hydrolase
MRRLSLIAAPDGGVWRKHRADEMIPLGEYGALPLAATILHPIASNVHEKADDRSLVLMIHAGAIRVLWMGDAGFVTEKELLARHVPLRCDILIRNQHSADASGLTELLLAARPQVIISSNDPTLAEEQMPTRVRAYCQEKGIPLFDLGIGGSVGITFEKDRASLQAFGDGQTATVNAR